MRAKVSLFFDVISPYAWLGFEGITRFRKPWDVEVALRPFFLGGVMRETGNTPPGLNPAKGLAMRRDLAEVARYWAVPVRPMDDPTALVDVLITKGSLKMEHVFEAAQRFLVALSRVRPELVEAAARELWLRRWSRQEDIHQPPHLLAVAAKIGLSKEEAAAVVRESSSQAVKDALAANTKEALDSGAFGAPWFVMETGDGDKHTFFGSDRFHVMADLLGKPFPGPMREHSKL